MLYTVDMEIEIDVQDAFDNLMREEKSKFIDENLDHSSNEALKTEIQKRRLKIAQDANYKELVDGVRNKFIDGGMTARDFLTDALGIQHSASIDEIINNLELILQ